MKIFISHQHKRLGPYSLEEARDLVYSGAVVRSDLAWQDGDASSVPLDRLLNSLPTTDAVATAAVTPDTANPMSQLRDPLEDTALTWLYVASIPVWLLLLFWVVVTLGFGLFPILLMVLAKVFGEWWFAAQLKANAVCVSETQLPEVHQAVKHCSACLGIEPPAVYVLQQNVWNAFAVKLTNHRSVILLSGAVDSVLLKGNQHQLAWLVGHELGHHAAGHRDFKRRLASLGGWMIWLYLWYSRRAEFTCDRAGLYCAGSLHASQRALINATVGAQLADQVNVAEAIAQWSQQREDFLVKCRILFSTHPHLSARLEQLAAAAREFGMVNSQAS